MVATISKGWVVAIAGRCRMTVLLVAKADGYLAYVKESVFPLLT